MTQPDLVDNFYWQKFCMSLARNIFLGMALIGSLGFSGDVKAASETVATGARIINSLSVIKTGDMDIGQIVPASRGGTIRIGATGSAECDAILTCLSDSIQPARFNVRGQAGYAYVVTLPDEIVMSNGSATLRITSLTSSVGASGLLNALGEGELAVGGTVQVGEQQEVGNYSGQFHITLEYN